MGSIIGINYRLVPLLLLHELFIHPNARNKQYRSNTARFGAVV